jgi:hypothetical protein
MAAISGMCEEAPAFLWGELVEQLANNAPEVFDGPCRGFSQQSLEL